MLDSKIVLIFLTIVLVLVILHTLFKVYLVKRTIKENLATNYNGNGDPPANATNNGEPQVRTNNGESQAIANVKPQVLTNSAEAPPETNEEQPVLTNTGDLQGPGLQPQVPQENQRLNEKDIFNYEDPDYDIFNLIFDPIRRTQDVDANNYENGDRRIKTLNKFVSKSSRLKFENKNFLTPYGINITDIDINVDGLLSKFYEKYNIKNNFNNRRLNRIWKIILRKMIVCKHIMIQLDININTINTTLQLNYSDLQFYGNYLQNEGYDEYLKQIWMFLQMINAVISCINKIVFFYRTDSEFLNFKNNNTLNISDDTKIQLNNIYKYIIKLNDRLSGIYDNEKETSKLEKETSKLRTITKRIQNILSKIVTPFYNIRKSRNDIEIIENFSTEQSQNNLSANRINDENPFLQQMEQLQNLEELVTNNLGEGSNSLRNNLQQSFPGLYNDLVNIKNELTKLRDGYSTVKENVSEQNESLKDSLKNVKDSSSKFKSNIDELKEFHDNYSKDLQKILQNKLNIDQAAFESNQEIQQNRMESIEKDLNEIEILKGKLTEINNNEIRSIICKANSTKLNTSPIYNGRNNTGQFIIFLNNKCLSYDKDENTNIHTVKDTLECSLDANSSSAFKLLEINNNKQYNDAIKIEDTGFKSLVMRSDDIYYPFYLIVPVNTEGKCLYIDNQNNVYVDTITKKPNGRFKTSTITAISECPN